MLAQTIGDILPVAVAVAISPLPVSAVILMLFTPQARTNGWAFAAGWLTALLVVGGVTLLIGGSGDVSTDESASDLAFFLRLAVGALFLAMAFRSWNSRPSEGQESEIPGWMSAIDAFTPAKALGLGALLAGVNPKNLGLTLSAGMSISQAGLDGAESVVALLVFVILASLTVVGPVIFYLLAGPAAKKPLEGIKGWLIANNATVMVVLLTLIGAKLFGDGLGGLVY